MFSALLFLVAVIFQVTVIVNTASVDNVVKQCRRKEMEFACTEDKYAEKRPSPVGVPQLAAVPFFDEVRVASKLELMQRNFECIADKLNVFSDKNLESSERYRRLVRDCESIQPTTPDCDENCPYRSIDGTCNNLCEANWGSTYSCFRRLWPSNYEGVSGFRKSVRGKKPLPNTRLISRELIRSVSSPTTDYNVLFSLFGQIIAHDLALFPGSMVRGHNLSCCEYATKKKQHPQCAPILIDQTDDFYSPKNVHCLDFPRTIPCSTCSVEKRRPMNVVTPWIDCSMIYGPTDFRAEKQRRYDGTGKLKSQYRGSEEFPLPDPSRGSRCGDAEKEEYCLKAGDARINQHTPLTIFQILLFREHNRCADQLKIINPHWDDEKIYQEARKILIAVFHIIIYNEYLPILLGPKLMSEYELNIGSRGKYDSSIHPSISVEFNTAAFRVHNIIPSRLVRGEAVELLRYLYFNEKTLYNDRLSAYLYKMSINAAEKYSPNMPVDLTWFMYRPLIGTWGFDLGAVDIQRGRDIGIPTYAQVIEYMEDRPETIEAFEDLSSYVSEECLVVFKKLYEDVRDVDFYAGMICEKIPADMIMSPTAAQIIAEQFKRLKYGDRFYVEHDSTFSCEQREALLSASLAKVVCDNTKVNAIQPMVFLFPSAKNAPQPCSAIPGVDLEKWRELR